MRTIKFAIVIVMGFALMLITAANMAPVDLHLVPQALGLQAASLTGVPLALVIVISLLSGIVLGLLVEFIREGKHRGRLEQKRKEIGRLKAENAKLAERLGTTVDDLSLLPG